MRTTQLRLAIPATTAATLVAAVFVTEAVHLQHLRGHAQAALDHAVAEVALNRTDASAVEAAIRSRALGKLEHVTVYAASDHRTMGTAELTFPSAWPSLKRYGYREVVTSTVRVQPPRT